MKNWKYLPMILATLAVLTIAPAASAQSEQPPKSSAQSSPRSDTPAGRQSAVGGRQSESQGLIDACSAAVEEFRAARKLVEALDSENAVLKERLETEKQTTRLLQELADTRRRETEALAGALAAKNETILAKDAVIASQEKLIAKLDKKKASILRRIGDVLIGIAAGAVLR